MVDDVDVRTCSLSDPISRRCFVDFMASQRFPMHVRAQWTREDVEQQVDTGRYDGSAVLEILTGAEAIGYAVLDDVEDDGILLDLRLAERWRGLGLGAPALTAVTDLAFGRFYARRLEGVTRRDNVAMRTVFRRCGYVLESCYRAGWSADEDVAAVGYARTRTDWQRGTVTPVPWDELLVEEASRETG